MEIVFTVLWMIYVVLIALSGRAWHKIPLNPEIGISTRLPGVTVVIPVRNEEKNIEALVDSLEALQYPNDKLEIILVNDASEDRTSELIQVNTSGKSNFRWFTLDEPLNFQGSYKKRALTAAIESAGFPIIVTTDADCQFHPEWLISLIGAMQSNNLVMACGPVAYHQHGCFSPILDIELASLVAVGAVSLNRGFPNMCNGANLAFSKEAFKQVDGYRGYEQIVSGDDEFLLYKMFCQYPRRVGFVKHSHSIVRTSPPDSWKEFVNQRKRWSGKWKAHKSKATRALALFVFVFHLVFIATLAMTLIGWYSWKIFIAQLTIKIFLEYIFVKPVLNFQGKKTALQWFFFMQLLYSFYTVFIGVAVSFTGFNWKNRKYR